MVDELLRDDFPSDAPFLLGFPLRRALWERWALADLGELTEARGRNYALQELTRRAQAAAAEIAASWRPSELIAVALLTEANRAIIRYYCDTQERGVLDEALAWVDGGPQPGAPVRASTSGLSRLFSLDTALAEPAAMVELINLRLMMDNPALEPFQALFDDGALSQTAPYPTVVESLERFFAERPPVSSLGLPLFEALRAPIAAHPSSLRDQLSFILTRFEALLPSWLRSELQRADDILAEETAARGDGGPGDGPVPTLSFDDAHYEEYERFSADADWMSNVVLLAKSTYVWLDQLSKEYGREIGRLDQVPDEELDRLARWGFNGLWLIGVWERSRSSRTVKQWRGNPEALASAYSLYDYTIAQDLGGDAAWWDLHGRAKARGIRMATDMVPNHTGIDSRWIVEHPDRFLHLDRPPYPGYRFTGADLCEDDRVSVHIEDGYWDHSDAAVVFKHVDHRDGRTRYIYHGNDGTSMPWNDTAQIDYLNPEAREAVIQTILDVARRSSIIRFDAAMTLAKKHIQRLWYPPPGHGGAIPSRAQYGTLSQADFDRLLPEEFWREVVDRVAAEVPDTLLLAEAFWLMEGYFVRTLGMHRVYNSAFMHMLRNEDNAEYRETLKNVLSFSAEVLKRFVNFMNNPDEETAVEQFGKGDKYFGICLLMVTLPGLPMVGHGQVQGYAEKYGMEYAKAYWDEHADEALVARHEREIFPLMRKRYLFSQVDEFALYDVVADGGGVDEDIYAYSNRAGHERAIVAYNNAFRDASGWLRQAAPTRRGGAEAELTQPTLIEALGLQAESGLIAMREHISGLWFLRDSRELAERGLRVDLHAYEAVVFVDLRILPRDGLWAQLAWRLKGEGVPDLDAAYRHLELEPLRDALWPILEGAELTEELMSAFGAQAGLEAGSSLPAILSALDEAGLTGTELRLARVVATCRALPPAVARDAGLAELAAEALGEPDLSALITIFTTIEDCEPGALVVAARDALGVNSHEGKLWFSGERMDALMATWPAAVAAIALEVSEGGGERDCGAEGLAALESLASAVAASEYRYDLLLEALGQSPEASPQVSDTTSRHF